MPTSIPRRGILRGRHGHFGAGHHLSLSGRDMGLECIPCAGAGKQEGARGSPPERGGLRVAVPAVGLQGQLWPAWSVRTCCPLVALGLQNAARSPSSPSALALRAAPHPGELLWQPPGAASSLWGIPTLSHPLEPPVPPASRCLPLRAPRSPPLLCPLLAADTPQRICS